MTPETTQMTLIKSLHTPCDFWPSKHAHKSTQTSLLKVTVLTCDVFGLNHHFQQQLQERLFGIRIKAHRYLQPKRATLRNSGVAVEPLEEKWTAWLNHHKKAITMQMPQSILLTKHQGVMRPNLNCLAKWCIWRGVNKAYDEHHSYCETRRWVTGVLGMCELLQGT